jgi:hypothetical protein
LLCWVGVHQGISKNSFNILDISYLNSPPQRLSSILPCPIPWIVSIGLIFPLIYIYTLYLHYIHHIIHIPHFWDHRGPWPKRAQERNEHDRTYERTYSLRKGMTKHILRGPAGWWPAGKILFFSASFIQKRKRLKHENTLTYLEPFCFCYKVFLLPVSLTKHKLLFSQGKPFSVPFHHDRVMVYLQISTLLECC